MKIYFEDGKLLKQSRLPIKYDVKIDAADGVTANDNCLYNLNIHKPNAIIYTNSIMAFSNFYAWNKELKVPEIYIRAGEHMVFVRIDKLTNRELREGHNLGKMYISGEFEDGQTRYKEELK